MMAYDQSKQAQTLPLPSLEKALVFLRKDLVGELEAINQYQEHIENIDIPEIKHLLEHIRDDEKEHVAEITHLINRIDQIQRQKFEEDHTTSATAAAASEKTAERDENLTVGNLFGKN
ncbi:MAG: rubrerythrin [Candidatus Riflebacteria bacterium]|nr:rubrerythrin [Candidatus Riflebacteria bacterium]